MRWLTALLCFVEAQYDTLEKGNCTRHNCIFRYIPAALLYFVEARSVIFGPAMRLFCQSPDMGDSDYKDLHDQVSGWPLSQLAAAIFSSVPSGAHGLMFKGRLEKGNCTRYNCKFRYIHTCCNHTGRTSSRASCGYKSSRLYTTAGLPSAQSSGAATGIMLVHISGVQSNMFTVQATTIQSSPLTSPRH